MSEKLKACAHCGSDDIGFVILWTGVEAHSVRCKQCGSASGERYTKDEAITAWNTRAPSQAEAEMREALEACVTRLAEFGYDHAVKCVMAILAKYPKGGTT